MNCGRAAEHRQRLMFGGFLAVVAFRFLPVWGILNIIILVDGAYLMPRRVLQFTTCLKVCISIRSSQYCRRCWCSSASAGLMQRARDQQRRARAGPGYSSS